jgi:hypothetical protein
VPAHQQSNAVDDVCPIISIITSSRTKKLTVTLAVNNMSSQQHPHCHSAKKASCLLLMLTIMLGMYRSALAVKPLVASATGLTKQRNFFNSVNVKAAVDKLTKPLPPKNDGKAAAAAAAEAGSGGILAFPKNHPFVFQLIVATLKTTAADLMTQLVAEGKSFSEVDWRRNGIFVVFGFAYLGGFQYYIMVNRYRKWFPTMDKFGKMSFAEKLKYRAGIIDAAKMVLFDLCIHMPFLYFPTYYTVKELVVGSTWNPVDWVRDGVMNKYSKNIKEDLTAMVQLWGPSDCVQFMLPIHIRMPFRHLVSFFWTAYVSFTRGAVDKLPSPPPLVASTMSGSE